MLIVNFQVQYCKSLSAAVTSDFDDRRELNEYIFQFVSLPSSENSSVISAWNFSFFTCKLAYIFRTSAKIPKKKISHCFFLIKMHITFPDNSSDSHSTLSQTQRPDSVTVCIS